MTVQNKVHEGGHFQKYLKNTPWYLLSSITTKAMGFLLIPLFTNYLSPEEFGTLSTLEALGRILPIFISLYLDASFNRYYYEEKNVSSSRVSLLFSTHFWFIVPWGIVICIASIFSSPLLMKDVPEVHIWPILAVVFTQLLNQLALMVTMVWNANLLAKRLAIFQMIMSFLSVGITIYLLVLKDVNWESRIYALAIVAFIQFLTLLYIATIKGWLSFCFDFKILKRSLKFSLPLMPNVIAGWIAMFSDRIILAHFGKLDEVGLYSVAAQFAMLIYVVNDALTKVQGPLSMSGLTSGRAEAKQKMSSFITGYFAVISLCYFSLILFSRELTYYSMSVQFHDAFYLIPILCFVYVLSGFYRVFTIIISFHKATWIISVAAFIQAAINISLNFLLIPKLGMYGAAWSTLLSMLGYTFFIYYSSQKIDSLNIEYQKLMKIALVLAIFTSISLIFDFNFTVGFYLLLYKVLIFTVFITVLLNLESSEYIKKILANKLKRSNIKA